MTSVKIDYEKLGGMVPAIIQEAETGEILMLGFINQEAFDLTVKTGKVHYWSRSKKRIWMKGESSGHTQEVKEIRLDCDNDSLLIKVEQKGGAACHEGYRSCFFRVIRNGSAVIDGDKIFNPEDVY